LQGLDFIMENVQNLHLKHSNTLKQYVKSSKQALKFVLSNCRVGSMIMKITNMQYQL
jgi:hypothetical protein